MKTVLKQVWNWGDKKRLAEACGITPQYLACVLAGRNIPSGKLALRIEREARKLGILLTAEDVMFVGRSGNPLVGHSYGD